MDQSETEFEAALRFVLAQEGGYGVNPHDGGGPTNMGVTLSTLARWRDALVSREDLRNLSPAEAAEIYRAWYWLPCRCDALPPPLALVVFDTAVNSGIHRAVMFLQSALEVPADGEPGTETLAVAQGCAIAETIRKILAIRLAFLEGLPSWPVFGAGWGRRISALETQALGMASGGGE